MHEYPEEPCAQLLTVESGEHESGELVVMVQPAMANARASDARRMECLGRMPNILHWAALATPPRARFSDRPRPRMDESYDGRGHAAASIPRQCAHDGAAMAVAAILDAHDGL